jgi:hypothetical protein
VIVTMPGRFYWIRATRPNETNVLGLAVYSDILARETFLLGSFADTRLAGHLDPILRTDETGLPYTVAVLSHLGAWVSDDRLKETTGEIAPETYVEIEYARATGQRPTIRTGHLLRSPALEPRWPLIEQNARRWTTTAQRLEHSIQ